MSIRGGEFAGKVRRGRVADVVKEALSGLAERRVRVGSPGAPMSAR
jgi:hypothetical protein